MNFKGSYLLLGVLCVSVMESCLPFWHRSLVGLVHFLIFLSVSSYDD